MGECGQPRSGAPPRSIRVGRVRRAARSVPEEWSPIRRKAGDRTRLTGRLIDSWGFRVGTPWSALTTHLCIDWPRPSTAGIAHGNFMESGGCDRAIHTSLTTYPHPLPITVPWTGADARFVPENKGSERLRPIKSRCFPCPPMVSPSLPRQGRCGRTFHRVRGADPVERLAGKTGYVPLQFREQR